MTARDIAARVAILAALKDRVDAAEQQARAELKEAMVTGDRLTVDAHSALLGSVTKTQGRVTVRVSDPARLLRWVADRYPTEVETIQQIRPGFVARIQADSRAAGQPCVAGELDVPGISVSESEPTVMYKPAEAAAELVEDLWRSGRVDLRTLLALPGGES